MRDGKEVLGAGGWRTGDVPRTVRKKTRMKNREKAVLGFTSQGRLFLTRKQSTGGYDLTGAMDTDPEMLEHFLPLAVTDPTNVFGNLQKYPPVTEGLLDFRIGRNTQINHEIPPNHNSPAAVNAPIGFPLFSLACFRIHMILIPSFP